LVILNGTGLVNRKMRNAAGLLVFTLLAAFNLTGQITKPTAKRAFTLDRDVETAFVWHELPRWEGGMLIGYENNRTNGPIIYTIDRDGRRDEMLFTLPDAAWIHLIDIAVSPAGEIAIVGSAITTDTRGTTFLVRIAKDREQRIVTRTWPFCPKVVTFAADGNLWTVGNLKDDDDHELADDVLRRFDPSGKLIGSVLLQARGPHTAEGSYLRAARDRVGWFNRQAQYIEFSLDGQEIGRYRGPEGAEERDISGVVLTEEGDVFAGRFGKGKAEIVVLDRDHRTWLAVSIPKEYISTWTTVVGFDGTTLVTYSTSGRLRRFKQE
jgi:hypothetical protein